VADQSHGYLDLLQVSLVLLHLQDDQIPSERRDLSKARGSLDLQLELLCVPDTNTMRKWRTYLTYVSFKLLNNIDSTNY
jgi:hypothetical protein